MLPMLYDRLINKKDNLAVIGLGYVGMPIAVAFAKKVNVIGFDINEQKIEQYKRGIDLTDEIGNQEIKDTSIQFTTDSNRLSEAHFIIVAVPTPINDDRTPDLEPIKNASHLIGQQIQKGTVVVYESTVYPGVTEEECVPIIEKESGLMCGVDWKIGYSPERINPGDKQHRLANIKKIVSGMDMETLDIVAKVYELVVEAGVYKAESIKVAEAAKVIENSQRDINIAFMNELSIIFHKMNIDTKTVLEAAGTKWNFLNFRPGLVGGHCIGVDPYYLTYKAEQLGYHSQVILAGRKINDDMGIYIVQNIIKRLIADDISVKNAKVAILGFTFKENCPDTRNSKVADIYNEFMEYGIEPCVVDPIANAVEAKKLYGISFEVLDNVKDMDVVVVAVAHDVFKKYHKADVSKFFNCNNSIKLFVDIKGIYDKSEFEETEYDYWRL